MTRREGLKRLASIGLALTVPGFAPARAAAPESRPLLVFAAASLQTALARIAADWKTQTGQTVVLSFAASSQLARQIEQGAPADLFISADRDWMDWAQGRKLIRPGTRRDLLGNVLVLIEPAGAHGQRPAEPGLALRTALDDLRPADPRLADARLAMGNPQSVPAGRYARQALQSLGLWSEIAPRIAGADNVRAALAFVARGEARYGIVYRSDARSEPRVRVVAAFPPESHSPIIYPGALTAASAHEGAAVFLDHLASPQVLAVFLDNGFEPAPAP